MLHHLISTKAESFPATRFAKLVWQSRIYCVEVSRRPICDSLDAVLRGLLNVHVQRLKCEIYLTVLIGHFANELMDPTRLGCFLLSEVTESPSLYGDPIRLLSKMYGPAFHANSLVPINSRAINLAFTSSLPASISLLSAPTIRLLTSARNPPTHWDVLTAVMMVLPV